VSKYNLELTPWGRKIPTIYDPVWFSGMPSNAVEENSWNDIRVLGTIIRHIKAILI